MTREEAIERWVIPALKNTWNEKKCDEILKALEQEPCNDCISRQAAIKPFLVDATEEWTSADIVKYLKSLPPVTPAPRIGRWKQYNGSWYECSECGAVREAVGFFENYCPNCGSKMEVEE